MPRPPLFVIRFLASLPALAVLFAGSVAALAAGVPTAILVDKKTNSLQISEYRDGVYKIVKTFHATLGQVKGDKEDEGDLKTPEGIYVFKTRLAPPGLAAKFGEMAFYMNYPNAYDEIAGHKGSNIMLHATNEPQRLSKNYDSQGCVVVKNEEIREIRPYIRLGLTPILIFQELGDEYLVPGRNEKLRQFFDSWTQTWSGKDIERYISHYHSDFKAQGMSKPKWKEYKANLNTRYATISVKGEDVVFYRHPKYSVITFTQNYRSTLKGGGIGHRSRGTKILYVAEENGEPKIISETYTTLLW